MAPLAQAPRPRRHDPRPRAVRHHERRRPQVNAIRDDLIRRGLPARRAVRYARELQAHWEDLRDERLAVGVVLQEAQRQADERLGPTKALVSEAVKHHRRETFGGRHPVLCYLLAPLALAPFVLMAFLLLVILPLSMVFSEPVEDGDADRPPPLTAQQEHRAWNVMLSVYVFSHAWSYVVPAGLAVVCHRRARRKMLSPYWAWPASAAVAVGASLQKVNLGWVPGERPVNFSISYGGWPEPSIVAVALASAALAAWVFHRRRSDLVAQASRLPVEV
jgi:hypothetical protein